MMDFLAPLLAGFVLGLVVGIVVCRWWYRRKLAKMRGDLELLERVREALG